MRPTCFVSHLDYPTHSVPHCDEIDAYLPQVYVPPLLIVNAWLITITYLQHTHPATPHYNETEWDWLRGTLSTYDRDYGILNKSEEILNTPNLIDLLHKNVDTRPKHVKKKLDEEGKSMGKE